MTKLLACILVLAFSLEVATSQKLSGTKETVKDDTGVGDGECWLDEGEVENGRY